MRLVDLPENLQDIAEAIGVENLVKLAELVGGQQIYIPKPESLNRSVLHQQIRAEFTGANVAELSRRFGYTASHIRRILSSGLTYCTSVDQLLESDE